MEFSDLQSSFDGNPNNPNQPQADEFVYGSGLLSKIVGTKESRQAVVKKVASAPIKIAEKTPGLTKIVGTQKSRAIVAGKVTSAIKTVGMAPMRGAFLGLLRINAFNLAYALKKQKDANSSSWNTFRNVKWAKFGGNRTELDSVVTKGAKVKAPLGLKFKKTKGADGIDYLEAAGETAALIAAAVPIIVVAIEALGKNKDVQIDAQTEADLKAQAAAEASATTAAQEAQDEINALTTEEERADLDNKVIKYVLIGGGILAAIGIAYLLFRKRKK